MTIHYWPYITAISLIGLSGCMPMLQKLDIKPISAELQPAKTLSEITAMPQIQKGLQMYNMAKGHKAIAISEDGFWAVSADTNSTEWAAWRALRDCSTKLEVRNRNGSFNSRGCFVYQIDNKMFTEPASDSAQAVMKATRKMPSLISIDLGESTSQAFARHQQQDQDQDQDQDQEHKAFAVSPGGGWGYSYSFQYTDDAVDRAIKLCDSSLSLYDSVCSLYALDGTAVMR